MFKNLLVVLICLVFFDVAIAEEILFDPTESDQKNLVLNAIVIDKEGKYCIINDILIEIGGEICDYFVTNIENEQVILRNNEGKEIFLKIN